MAFWSYHGSDAMTSTIDTILDKDSFELRELLADDEVLQECKALNSRLVAFLSRPESIAELFTYILDEPKLDDSHERCYTFPYVSSELLTCSISQIHDAIYSEPCADHLRRVLAFPARDGPLNAVLTGYYAKVVSTMLKRNSEAFLVQVDAHVPGGREGYLRLLMGHMDMQSIADLLMALTTPLEALNATPPPPPMLRTVQREEQPRIAGTGEDGSPVESWLRPVAFARTLLDAVRSSESGEAHSLAACLFEHLVSQYGWQVFTADEDLMEDMVDTALDARDQTARTCALAALTELLKVYAAERSIGGEGAAAARDDGCRPLLDAVGARMEGFVAMLNMEPVLPPHLAPFLRDGGIPDCVLVTPVGAARLQLYAFLAKLLPPAPLDTQQSLVQCRVYDIALDAFERYANNNALHSHICAMVQYALSEESPEELALAVVGEARLHRRLVALSDPHKVEEKGLDGQLDGLLPGAPAQRRAPWMGHVIVMGNALCACAERHAGVRALLEADEDWKAFVEGPLATANEYERRTLGGQAPIRASDIDSDEDDLFASKELELDQMAAALAKHQSRRGTTPRSDLEVEDAGTEDGGGAGGTAADVSEEVERKFGAYIGQKGFLHELDGGLSAIQREQDDKADRERNWEANHGDGDGGGAGDADFGSRQTDFHRVQRNSSDEEQEGEEGGFARAGAGNGGDGAGGEEPFADLRLGEANGSSPGLGHGGGGGSFDAVFGPLAGGGGGGGGVGDGGVPAFDADFGELAADAMAQSHSLGGDAFGGMASPQAPVGANAAASNAFAVFEDEAAVGAAGGVDAEEGVDPPGANLVAATPSDASATAPAARQANTVFAQRELPGEDAVSPAADAFADFEGAAPSASTSGHSRGDGGDGGLVVEQVTVSDAAADETEADDFADFEGASSSGHQVPGQFAVFESAPTQTSAPTPAMDVIDGDGRPGASPVPPSTAALARPGEDAYTVDDSPFSVAHAESPTAMAASGAPPQLPRAEDTNPFDILSQDELAAAIPGPLPATPDSAGVSRTVAASGEEEADPFDVLSPPSPSTAAPPPPPPAGVGVVEAAMSAFTLGDEDDDAGAGAGAAALAEFSAGGDWASAFQSSDEPPGGAARGATDNAVGVDGAAGQDGMSAGGKEQL